MTNFSQKNCPPVASNLLAGPGNVEQLGSRRLAATASYGNDVTALAQVLTRADLVLDRSVERLFEFLQIRSISTDPMHALECGRAAEWLVNTLASLGFTSSTRDTEGHPIVVGHMAGPTGSPRVLFYGHYDVQPADPLEKWQTPPFTPVCRLDSDGIERIYARGAADDKGQLMTFLEAIRAFVETRGSLPLSVTVLIEGEEETGSLSLPNFLRKNREELQADIALICDSDMFDECTPAITTRLRGLMHEELVITGPSVDLHSGCYGGSAANPIKFLARILAELHDNNGRITLPGFYDDVVELPRHIRQQWADLKFDSAKFLGRVGLKQSTGEEGYSVLEQLWARPTLEINGITGGYTGVGTKTVIPSQASAKISCRLVADQDPQEIRTALRAFVRERLPAGLSVEFGNELDGSPAVRVHEDNPYLVAARQALESEWQKEPVVIGSGFSIPIVGSFRSILGIESLMIGFGLEDDGAHSPNEKYNLASFHRGIRSWIRVIDALTVPSRQSGE